MINKIRSIWKYFLSRRSFHRSRRGGKAPAKPWAPQLNPTRLSTGYMRLSWRVTGLKHYRGLFQYGKSSRVSRRRFDTATRAKVYAAVVKVRYVRLIAARLTRGAS